MRRPRRARFGHEFEIDISVGALASGNRKHRIIPACRTAIRGRVNNVRRAKHEKAFSPGAELQEILIRSQEVILENGLIMVIDPHEPTGILEIGGVFAVLAGIRREMRHADPFLKGDRILYAPEEIPPFLHPLALGVVELLYLPIDHRRKILRKVTVAYMIVEEAFQVKEQPVVVGHAQSMTNPLLSFEILLPEIDKASSGESGFGMLGIFRRDLEDDIAVHCDSPVRPRIEKACFLFDIGYYRHAIASLSRVLGPLGKELTRMRRSGHTPEGILFQ